MRQLNGRDVDPALVFRADGAIPVFTLRVKRAFSGNKEASFLVYFESPNNKNVWNIFCRIGGDGSHKEAITTRRRLQGCVARISRHGRRNSLTVYTAGKEDAASAFAEIASFLRKITSASQLRVEQRWQLIIYWAFRKYRLIYRLYPPLLGDQIMLPLA